MLHEIANLGTSLLTLLVSAIIAGTVLPNLGRIAAALKGE